MRQSQNLQIKQGQSLVMTQQLQQSIKLLQYNAQELQAFLSIECEQNPFLLAEDPIESQPASEENETAAEQDAKIDSDADAELDHRDDATTAVDELQQTELAGNTNDESWDYEPSERISITQRNSDGDAFERDDMGEVKITLKEHLSAQFLVDETDPVKRRLGLHLIDLVDEAGYIKEDLGELADQFGTEETLLEEVLLKLQACDPAGICARDLSECLALQLKERDRFDPAMEALVAHLDLLASARIDQLLKVCGVEREDLNDMIAEIRSLNPKPGLAFAHDLTEQALPDVIVKREGGNKWKVELNQATLPRVLVNREYHAQIVMNAQGADKKYLSDQMNHANWLVKAMDQRAQTIVKVATDIVIQQENFFKLGIHHLKPLTLKDIAASTGYHESTISRVTTGKYMMTPRGLFELKYFFTSGLAHARGGDDVSSSTVKYLIKQIIDEENSQAPCSDDDIAERLKKQGINVARRTVAKYRESLHIPSSSQRRRVNLQMAG
jgi:RNA polymerase sigma-54 factor